MQRVFFFQNNEYKGTTPHISDPDFISLSKKNDLKAQKNGTKKTVYWVKKKPKDEDGTLKGEKWATSQQYIGDWKDNNKEGYGIKIYNNKDKYEGYWKLDLRHGKGTYWLSIGKNKYRKLYTGDWYENKKEGKGIYFYNDGSCYDGIWKNSKRDGKGLMIYANGDVYDGAWRNDAKHGYGIFEKQTGDKYYGYWKDDLKEGQGYFYYKSTGKIYLGEWHEDTPRCGIFSDVDDVNIQKEFKKHFKAENEPVQIPLLKLNTPEVIIEDSINNVIFLRNVKFAKDKTFNQLFPHELNNDLIKIFSKVIESYDEEKEIDNIIPTNVITIKEFKSICLENLGQEVTDETLDLIFYVFEKEFTNEEIKIDFILFSRLFYLVYMKKLSEESSIKDNKNINSNNEINNENNFNKDNKDSESSSSCLGENFYHDEYNNYHYEDDEN